MPKVTDNQGQDIVNAAADAAHDAVDATSRMARDSVEAATAAAHNVANAGRENVAAGLRKATTTANDIGGKAVNTAKKYPMRTVLIIAVVAAISGFVVGAIRTQ